MLREKSSGVGSMWGRGVEWSESSSILKKSAPGMCFARYRAWTSIGGKTPTGAWHPGQSRRDHGAVQPAIGAKREDSFFRPPASFADAIFLPPGSGRPRRGQPAALPPNYLWCQSMRTTMSEPSRPPPCAIRTSWILISMGQYGPTWIANAGIDGIYATYIL
jgi:hypothetical protein